MLLLSKIKSPADVEKQLVFKRQALEALQGEIAKLQDLQGASFGCLKEDAELLGSGLKIKAGEPLVIHPATNQPKRSEPQFFVASIYWKHDGSILVNQSEIQFSH